MHNDGIVDDLLDRWEAARESGEEISLEDLCRDHPHLLERVSDCVAKLKAFSQFARVPSVSDLASQPNGPPSAQSLDFGRYKLVKTLGEGGMGTVWIAEQHEPVRRLVAIKMIKSGMYNSSALARFEAECQALAMMDHPNIAKVFDGGRTKDGVPYLVMELIDGGTITQVCHDEKLSLNQRLMLFVEVCAAVQHAHQKSIIHRDLKPSNILVTKVDGRFVVKVIDFGVAKALAAESRLADRSPHTQFGQLLGTLLYMSPEQLSETSSGIDTRSDVYSLGVVLYELLTGSTPTPADTLVGRALLEAARIVRDSDPVPPSRRIAESTGSRRSADVSRIDPRKLQFLLKGDLDWIVMKAIDKERTHRYESADGMKRDIERFLNDLPVEARPPTLAYRASKFYKKHRLQMLAGGAFLLVTLISAAAVGWNWLEVRAQSEIATRAEQARRTQEQVANALELRSRSDQRQPGWSWLNDARVSAWSVPVDVSVAQLLREEISRIALRPDLRKTQVVFDDMRVGACAFSDDGNLLAVGERTSTFGQLHARVYDTRTWKLMKRIAVLPSPNRIFGELEADGISAISFGEGETSQRKILLGTRGGEVIAWAVDDESVISRWRAHEAYVDDVSSSDDGSVVLTSSRDNTVKWWGEDGKVEVKTQKLNGNRYLGRLGKQILVNNGGPTLLPIRQPSNEKPRKLKIDINTRLIRGVADWGVLSTNADGETALYNKRGDLLRKYYADRFPTKIATVTVGAGNKYSLIYCDEAVEIWDLVSGERVGALVGASIECVELDPKWPRFVVADGKELAVYEVREDPASLRSPVQSTPVEAIAVLDEGRSVMTVSQSADDSKASVARVWNVERNGLSREVLLPTTRVDSVFSDGDARTLFYLDDDHQLMRYDPEKGEATCLCSAVDGLAHVRFDHSQGHFWLAYRRRNTGSLLLLQKLENFWQVGVLNPGERSLSSKWSNQGAAIFQGYSRFHDMAIEGEQVAAISADRLVLGNKRGDDGFLELQLQIGTLQKVVAHPQLKQCYLIANDRGEVWSVSSERDGATIMLKGLGMVTAMARNDDTLLIGNNAGELFVCGFGDGAIRVKAVLGPFSNSVRAIERLEGGRFAVLIRKELCFRIIDLREIMERWRRVGVG